MVASQRQFNHTQKHRLATVYILRNKSRSVTGAARFNSTLKPKTKAVCGHRVPLAYDRLDSHMTIGKRCSFISRGEA